MIFVKPKEGLNIRHPEKVVYVLPTEGCWVNNTTAIKRLVRDGDLEIIDTPPETETKGKRKKAATVKAADDGDNQ